VRSQFSAARYRNYSSITPYVTVDASDDAYHAILVDALPLQPRHQARQLVVREHLLLGLAASVRPDELPLIQPPRC
jgi:hypothetical protein